MWTERAISLSFFNIRRQSFIDSVVFETYSLRETFTLHRLLGRTRKVEDLLDSTSFGKGFRISPLSAAVNPVRIFDELSSHLV